MRGWRFAVGALVLMVGCGCDLGLACAGSDGWVGSLSRRERFGCDLLRYCCLVFGLSSDADELESLILAQSERWRHA